MGMQSQVIVMERQIGAVVKEGQQLHQRANEALTSSAEAEQHFRRLESQCKTLLERLLQQHPQPHTQSLNLFPQANSGAIKSFRLPAMSPVPEFNLPVSFDFATMLTNPGSKFTAAAGGGGGGGGAVTPKIKSSLRGSGSKSGSGSGSDGCKSISFGPTTTFTSTDQLDDPVLIANDRGTDWDPAATSTLKKSSLPLFIESNNQNLLTLNSI